jgi:hypothetical protein
LSLRASSKRAADYITDRNDASGTEDVNGSSSFSAAVNHDESIANAIIFRAVDALMKSIRRVCLNAIHGTAKRVFGMPRHNDVTDAALNLKTAMTVWCSSFAMLQSVVPLL